MPHAAGVIALRVAGGEEQDRNTPIFLQASAMKRVSKTNCLTPLSGQLEGQSGGFVYVVEIQVG
jgi:hypothetical protein